VYFSVAASSNTAMNTSNGQRKKKMHLSVVLRVYENLLFCESDKMAGGYWLRSRNGPHVVRFKPFHISLQYSYCSLSLVMFTFMFS
jgi:hypothetical protein